jgi:hypothetical protein
MKFYFAREYDLFGNSGIAVYNSKKDLLVFLTDVHAVQMEKMNLDPTNKDHIIVFLKNQYPKKFKGNIFAIFV